MKHYVCFWYENISTGGDGLLLKPVSLTGALRQHTASDYLSFFEDLEKIIFEAGETVSGLLNRSENLFSNRGILENVISYGTFG